MTNIHITEIPLNKANTSEDEKNSFFDLDVHTEKREATPYFLETLFWKLQNGICG